MDKKQRELIIRLAKKDPSFKAKVINILKTDKTASANNTNDAAAFAAWAKMSNPTKMSEQDVIKYLVSNGVSIKEPGQAPRAKVTGPLKQGEIVKVDPFKCLSPENKKLCSILAHDPQTEYFCIIKNVVVPADTNSRCTIEVNVLDNEDGSVKAKTHTFQCVTPTQVAGITKKIDAACKAISKAEVGIAKEKSNIEQLRTVISLLEPSDRKVKAAEKKIASSEAKIAKFQSKILDSNNKIDVQKALLRIKCLEPNDQLGLYRTGFKNLASFQHFVENPPPPAKDFILVYNRGGRLPTPALRKQFIDHSNASRTRQTLMEGEFDDLVEGGVGSYANTYYEGQIISAQYNKQGEFYFVLKANDRSFTSVNPSVGEIFYISTANDMPSDREWGEDLKARLRAVVEEHLSGL